jgi:hypothetical protein
VLAWPAPLKRMLIRLSIFIVLQGAVLAVDTPLSMAARIWTTLMRAQATDVSSHWAWLAIFMNGGGRMAIGLLVAAWSITIAKNFSSHTSVPKDDWKSHRGTD